MYAIRYRNSDAASSESDHSEIRRRIEEFTAALETLAGDIGNLAHELAADTAEGRALRDLLSDAERAIGGYGGGVTAILQEAWEEVDGDEWEDDAEVA